MGATTRKSIPILGLYTCAECEMSYVSTMLMEL